MAVLLAALVAGAVPVAEASIPPPESWPSLVEEPAASVLQPPTLEDLAVELAAPELPPAPTAAASIGEPFRLFEGLQLDLAARSEPRFRLYPRLETHVWAITPPEPFHVELELPLTSSRFGLYSDPRPRIAVGGTFITVDPMGYQDSPNLYQYALNNPIMYGDPLGLAVEIQIGSYTFIVGDELADYVKQRFGRVLGVAAEGYDLYRALTTVDSDPAAILPAFVRQAVEQGWVESKRSLRIYNRLNTAYAKGGTEGFWSEYMEIRGELIGEYGEQLLEQPFVGRTVHAFMQASEAEGAFERGMYEGRGAFRFMEDLALLFGVTRVATAARAGTLTTQAGWTLPEGGGGAWIRGRWYTEHALERMAPRTPQVMAELERRALARARAAGLQPGTPQFRQWWARYGPNPRNVPPIVVESEIAAPGSTGVRVITNAQGDVVTVIPGGG